MPSMVVHPAHQSPTNALIPEYFAGREVFITGATGFMGKVLVERLLWTCPEISRLHLLMRRKKDVTPEERLKELKQCQVFDVIRQHCPERLEKLSVVAGDITQHMFNLTGSALQQLSQVSVTIHSAATLKFDEPLGLAVNQNVRPVISVMGVCDQLPMMEVLIYVSTAYSNAEHSSIEERVYPAPTDIRLLFSIIDNLQDDKVAPITPQLISPKPNTYTFTKAVAESVVADRAHSCNYATAIFRPSIVVSSLQHPFPGWVDNLNGPSGIVVAFGKGLLHVAPIIGDVRADMIPVDIVIDTLIAVAWEAGIDNSRETRVYNCSSYDNSLTWSEFKHRILRWIRQHPFNATLWYPFLFLNTNILFLKIAMWVFETAPLCAFGIFQTIFGIKQRTKMSTVCCRIQAAANAFKFFTTREWHFSTENVRRLRARLTAADAAIYNLDPQTIDWESHTADFVKGLRKYLLRESDADLQKAQLRMWLLFIIHRITQCIIIFAAYKLLVFSGSAILRIIFPLVTLFENM